MSRGRLFAAMAALAVCICAGLGIYMRAAWRGERLDGEVILGERADAAGVSMGELAVIGGHFKLEKGYEPETGLAPANMSCGPEEIDYEFFTTCPEIGINFDAFETSDTGDAQYKFTGEAADIVDAAIAAREEWQEDEWEYYEWDFDLADYMDYYPIECGVRYISDEQTGVFGRYIAAVLNGKFRIPVAEGSIYTARIWQDEDGYYHFSFRESERAGTIYSSDSAYTSEGYIYFTANVLTADGAHPDGGTLPGGGWGVWRMRAEAIDPPDEDGWWRANCYAKGDPESIENVYLLPEGWQEARVDVSHDGRSVYVAYELDGEIHLTVLDAATGEVRGSARLFSRAELKESGCEVTVAEGALALYQQEDCFVYVLEDKIAAAAMTDGGVGEIFTAPVQCGALPEELEYVREELDFAGLDYAFDGERIAALLSTAEFWDEGSRPTYRIYRVLNLASREGVYYSEWLREPFGYTSAWSVVDYVDYSVSFE